MVICLERGADLHMAQLMPLPLTVSCFSKIQIGFTFLVRAHLGSPGKGPLNGCVCVWVCISKDYFTTSQVNRMQEKPCVLLKMFDELNVRRKSIVTLALSEDML